MPEISAPQPPTQARRWLGPLALVLGAAVTLAAVAAETEELDPFDAIPDLEALVNAVNEGSLHFLPADRAQGAHSHQNRISIHADSLEDGWVGLQQCHEHLDPVPAAQIVYNPEGIRELAILHTENIGDAWVEGNTVQLRAVEKRATLCVQGETRALKELAAGGYRLRNGPYMRKFLDGYYPMRVALDIAYPPEVLVLARHLPPRQEGFEVRTGPSQVQVDASFEGRLFTCFDFCRAGEPQCLLADEPCGP